MMKHLFLLSLLLLTLSSCRTARHAASGGSARPATSAPSATPEPSAALAKASVAKVNAQRLNQQHVTARVQVTLTAKGKEVSASGQLRMKRDDVIQLSVTLLGFEVGRMEFTPTDVLVIDRVHKQYVRAAYSDIPFLASTGIDFYALQSLFWHELFVPGKRGVPEAGSFAVTQSAEGLTLTPQHTPLLTYTFVASADNGVLQSLRVQDARHADPTQFACRYANFTTLSGKAFPATIEMGITGSQADASLRLQLSRLNHDASWNTRTTVSQKYTRRNADEVFKALLQ